MFKKQKVNYLILFILFVAALVLWSFLFHQAPADTLEVHFFDVGQGDSIFIETPTGQQVLIDGGPDKTVLERLNQVMPFYDRTIDLVILTHPDADHITGLVSVLDYYQISHILTSGFAKETNVYREWRKLIEEKNIPVTLAQSGQKIIFSEEIFMDILWPAKDAVFKSANNYSIVGRLVYGQTEFLLSGDIEKEVEQQLVKHLMSHTLGADILKVPHHGSKSSSSQNFLEAVNPQVAIISVGRENRYGHPQSAVLDRLKDYLIYRTDQDGSIQVFTNGRFFNIIKEYES